MGLPSKGEKIRVKKGLNGNQLKIIAMSAMTIDHAAFEMFTALTIPILKCYNGQRGKWKGMKWFFYLYYPLHLFLCGILRLALHGNAGVF